MLVTSQLSTALLPAVGAGWGLCWPAHDETCRFTKVKNKHVLLQLLQAGPGEVAELTH